MGLAQKVVDFFGHAPVEGDYGIEVEVEGINLPAVGRPWEAKEDHSLRGEAKEYVLKRPFTFEGCPATLSKLELALTGPDVVVHDSRRTSVHVHRNMLQDTVLQVYNLIALYYIFEIPMTEFAGPYRVGNMYCLRGCDAEFLPFQIVQSLQQGTYLRQFRNRDDVRYAGLNLCSLGMFGSVEFRSFKGTIRTAEIMPWLGIIEALHDAALRFKDPQEISAEFFRIGPTKFLENIMPEAFVKHVKTFTDYEDTMIVGHQYTFEIAHAINDWHVEIEDVPVKKKNMWNDLDLAMLQQLQQPNWAPVPARRRGAHPVPNQFMPGVPIQMDAPQPVMEVNFDDLPNIADDIPPDLPDDFFDDVPDEDAA